VSNPGDQTRVDLIRHGQHLLGDVVCGISDPELSDTGWTQLENQCEKLAAGGASWDVCIASPRKRCAAFATELTSRLSMELVIEDGFGEVDFGQWEGLSISEITSHYPGQWQNWVTNPDSEAPHGGESYGSFLARVDHAWSCLIGAHKNKKILLFSHGGVIRAIFASAFSLEPDSLFRFNVPHACHSRIISYHREGKADWCQLDSHNG
jgi:alpha-ribazole phosphatase/probable phosphoglycerate mutase